MLCDKYDFSKPAQGSQEVSLDTGGINGVETRKGEHGTVDCYHSIWRTSLLTLYPSLTIFLHVPGASSVSVPITKIWRASTSPQLWGFRGSCAPSLNLHDLLRGLVHGLGLRVIEPVSRVPSRFPKPQGEGPFRGTACRRWPAAAATRTWGRVRGAGTRPSASSGWGVPGAGARGSPERGYKNAARAQEGGLDGGAALQPCREASSSCFSAAVRPPAGSPTLPATLPQRLQPGACDDDAGGDSGLLRDSGPAVHSALGPSALLRGVLGQDLR
ncbi:hypothetical protein HispidOSU_014178, partial [Sigmodon hispidus]